MGNPLFVDCPKDVWTKVATNVVTGVIKKVSTKPRVYLQTFRITGDPAPTLQSDGVLVFDIKNPNSENISAVSGIDIYIYPVGKAGRVRMDL